MTVTLVVTHGRSTSTLLERRFEEDATIQRVKDQLYPITGTNPNDMALFLIPMGKDSSASAGTPLIPDSATLASFYPENYMVLKVVDKNPSSSVNVGMFDDLSAVEKYTMSEEDYDKLSTSFRRFKRDVLGIKQERNDQSNAGELDELMSKYKIGSRCEVGSKGEFPKRGEILYVGPLEGLSKYWIGVKLDEPFGKNDGSVKGKRYFDAGGPKYGSFSRPEDVNVGDFPPLDDFEDDSDEEL